MRQEPRNTLRHMIDLDPSNVNVKQTIDLCKQLERWHFIILAKRETSEECDCECKFP